MPSPGWVDVLDQDGARPAAIRLPQLLAVGAVVGGEEQSIVPQRSGRRDCRRSPPHRLSLGLMFLTRTVPALLPSDFHSSSPWVPSSAAKNNRPPISGQGGGTVPW